MYSSLSSKVGTIAAINKARKLQREKRFQITHDIWTTTSSIRKPGADLGFSRGGGGGFSKKNRTF